MEDEVKKNVYELDMSGVANGKKKALETETVYGAANRWNFASDILWK